MRLHNGELGRFSYNETQFQLSNDIDGKLFLEYIGKETDGNKIKIPDGITDATGMFQDKNIVSQPRIPDSVQTADCMFAGCDALVHPGDIPESIRSADWMYACCPSLEEAPKLPEGLVSGMGMFNGCTALKSAPEIPSGIKEMRYMFWDCPDVESSELPEGIKFETVYGENMKVQQDDLWDLPETKVLQDGSRLAKLFGLAEAEAVQEKSSQAVEEKSDAEPVMTKEQRDALLSTLGLEESASGSMELDIDLL